MKKFLSVLITALLLFSVFTLSGCNSDDSEQVLTYGKKYYLANTLYDDLEDSFTLYDVAQNYFYVFDKNGTGEYSYYHYFQYDENYARITSYTVNFKYLIVEDTVVCFYDSKSYGEGHNQDVTAPGSKWKQTLGFSKDILLSLDRDLYVCETYLPKIPNFAK